METFTQRVVWFPPEKWGRGASEAGQGPRFITYKPGDLGQPASFLFSGSEFPPL